MRMLPIRVRLGLWFSFVFAIAIVILGAISWLLFESSIYAIQGREVYERVRSVQRFMDAQPAEQSRSELEQEIAQTFGNTHGGKWLQICDEHGAWLYRSPHSSKALSTLPLPNQLRSEGQQVRFKVEDTDVLGLIKPIQSHGHLYTVEMGMTLNYTRDILNSFLRKVAILTPIALLLAAIAGYFMSRKALNPMMAIAREARSIDRNNLNRRLVVPASHDEISHLAETLNLMLDRIEAGFRSIREFTANAAHELRTPVTVIRTEAEISLCFPRDSAEYIESLREIQNESTRMSAVIDDLLTLARADAEADSLRFQATDMIQLAQQAVEAWTPIMQNASIDLLFETQREAQVWILCDRPGVLRLLNVFLENAWKNTPQGGRVLLSLAEDFDTATLTVTDSGIGISPENLPHIFERFRRFGKPLHTSHPGSGIGLALAKQIADCHRTQIHVHSTEGKGSSFSISFKRAEERDRVGEGTAAPQNFFGVSTRKATALSEETSSRT